jgi:LmbE family N-acetylglucosaminyl deacetylase
VKFRFLVAAAALVSTFVSFAGAELVTPTTSSDLVQELRNFQVTGSVLYVGAHPDDENNRLLPYLARGRALRTAYLSLTRGDGGQNLIGPELGEELGMIRTQELLAARRVDGATQYFSRARDFGFSKDSADTLRRWDRQQVLSDVVRVIRIFRPDVVITRFSTVPGGTHGHHTASAILALEAFKLAGDPNAFPEQLTELKPWQPKRILWNSWVPPGSNPLNDSATFRLDAGGFDPLLGESFGEIGARGRTMHKSQGEGRPSTRGIGLENFTVLAGDPASKDLFDGIDITWNRIPGGAEIDAMASDLLAKFVPENPVASIPALLALRAKLAALNSDPLVALKRVELDHILRACLGLFVETAIPDAQVVPGETLKLRHTIVARSNYPIRWIGVRYPALHRTLDGDFPALKFNEVVTRDSNQVLPVDTSVTQPYWLRDDGTEGMFRVDESNLIGLPENPPAFPVEHVFEIDGQTLVVADEPVQLIVDPVRGELRRRIEVIAPVSLKWTDDLALFAPNATKAVTVEVAAARGDANGQLQLDVPSGWKVTPASQPFDLKAVGERTRLTFNVTAPNSASTVQLLPRAVMGERRYHRGRTEIRYDHIPILLLQRSAVLKMVSLDLAIRGRAIGYLSGAGDQVSEALARMGYSVTPLASADLDPKQLSRFDAIVVGVRAFNTRSDLDSVMPALFAYAEQGGTVIAQYNTANGLRSTRFAPYDLKLSGDRVTNADAPVTFLAADHPALNSPNKIATTDFDGWVQERARYVPKSWDEHFTPLIASGDRGETPLQGTLLVARHGRGYVVYTGLSFFRELPAGVPGAYRLFANLVSLGK